MNPVQFLAQKIIEQKSNHIVLFPGTFNPWHEGHQACLDLLPKELPVIVIPDRNPEKMMTSANALGDLPIDQKKYFLFKDFLTLKGHNPTYYWYSELKEYLPKTKISLLMGYDAFSSLSNWIEGENLIKALDNVFVAGRLNQVKDYQEVLLSYQKIKQGFSAEFLGHHPFEHISSTKIKKEKKKEGL